MRSESNKPIFFMRPIIFLFGHYYREPMSKSYEQESGLLCYELFGFVQVSYGHYHETFE